LPFCAIHWNHVVFCICSMRFGTSHLKTDLNLHRNYFIAFNLFTYRIAHFVMNFWLNTNLKRFFCSRACSASLCVKELLWTFSCMIDIFVWKGQSTFWQNRC
jgi:hypothetical protein